MWIRRSLPFLLLVIVGGIFFVSAHPSSTPLEMDVRTYLTLTPFPLSTPLPALRPTPTGTLLASAIVFDAAPGPDVPTLHELAAGTSEDVASLSQIVEYFETNRERLALLWREDDPTRLAALFAMYIVHISTPYGAATYPTSFTEYLSQPYAHCGTYVYGQYQIAHALGLTTRSVEFVGEHAWLEVLVNGQWEVFDSTTNVWLNRNVIDLLAGEPREYRAFYTPLLDIDQTTAREHIALGYDMQRLRTRMPGVGVFYHPPGELFIAGEPVLPAESL